jgi:hypothetical protein
MRHKYSYLFTYVPVRNVVMRADTLGGQVGGGWVLEIEIPRSNPSHLPK